MIGMSNVTAVVVVVAAYLAADTGVVASDTTGVLSAPKAADGGFCPANTWCFLQCAGCDASWKLITLKKQTSQSLRLFQVLWSSSGTSGSTVRFCVWQSWAN